MSKQAFDHTTSRHCADTSCNGTLHDSIINFGEPLPEAEIKSAFKAGDEADVCIVLGSSLRVSPANLVPMKVYRRGQKVVICKYVYERERAATCVICGKCIMQLSLLRNSEAFALPVQYSTHN